MRRGLMAATLESSGAVVSRSVSGLLRSLVRIKCLGLTSLCPGPPKGGPIFWRVRLRARAGVMPLGADATC
jgi:hypothetical protein